MTAKAKRAAQFYKVFIVEDHPVFRRGLAQMINEEKDLLVCGQSGTADEARRAIARQRPDIVLVDLSLGGGHSGLDLIRDIRSSDSKIKLLVVSMHDEALYAQRVLRCGGDGYIMKQQDPEEIIGAIRDVLSGHLYVSEAVISQDGHATALRYAAKRGPLDQLTDAELQALEMIGKGNTPKEIAAKTNLGPAAVVQLRSTIGRKLGLRGDAALSQFASKWVKGDPV